MEDDRRMPLGPRRRGRASFPMAPPPLRKTTATLPGGGTGTVSVASKSPSARGRRGVADGGKGTASVASKSPSARGRGGLADGGTGKVGVASKSPSARGRGGVADGGKGTGTTAAAKSPGGRARGSLPDSPCLGKPAESPVSVFLLYFSRNCTPYVVGFVARAAVQN